ncbi:MAG: DUF2129 domain-containing protein [Thermobacillus sp.]|uniref:Uncharacterized protein n=1 Tax=Thermobacillus composti (strain DSM 18247 / JCM 13945 / KWC4) TaxID=717605 RepID=L0EDG6_THECK|nr:MULTISPECIES: YlbG family protein [Thermobacillus]AGA58318.1 hypothetical protein Theco_2198 [Thermobacillus composti KWC4]REK58518.1 MAG: DUF2129 domain-containing protein [Thermobacillus sp.]
MNDAHEQESGSAANESGSPFAERVGYIVWVNDHRLARNLDKYGTVHYISRRMNYAVIYMDADKAEDTIRNIERLPYVKKAERSFRGEIRTEYSKNVPDKTRSYSI